ncbi:MAG TPA: hypothetical protein VF258_02040 [Luteolibacter sp.]
MGQSAGDRVPTLLAVLLKSGIQPLLAWLLAAFVFHLDPFGTFVAQKLAASAATGPPNLPWQEIAACFQRRTSSQPQDGPCRPEGEIKKPWKCCLERLT